MKMGKKFNLILFFSVLFFSCDDSDLPKQNGFLRIEFEEPSYLLYNEKNTLLNFYYNSSAINIDQVGSDQFFLDYFDLNLSLNLSFYEINQKEDLENKFRDFTLILDTHTKKSNGVIMREYDNNNKTIFGKIFEIKGDVASPIQFYLTDSTSSFISGSVNLKRKSKYDSIFPSIQYVKNDILVLFESVNWK